MAKKLYFFSKYGLKTRQTAPRPGGHQHGFPNYLWQCDDRWYFFNSIQVTFHIEVSMYHTQLHNEDWSPKGYVLRKPCSHPMSTVEESSMRGVTMKWTRSELCGQQCTSNGRTFMGWYITGNPKMIVHIMWSPVSMATRMIQNDPSHQNGNFGREIKVVIYFLTTNLDCQLLHAFHVCHQWPYWNKFIVLFLGI